MADLMLAKLHPQNKNLTPFYLRAQHMPTKEYTAYVMGRFLNYAHQKNVLLMIFNKILHFDTSDLLQCNKNLRTIANKRAFLYAPFVSSTL